MLRPKVRTHGISIRKATRGDARRIAALSTQLGYPSSKRSSENRLVPLLKDREHLVLVAEIASREVVAWIHAYVRRLVESDPHVEVGGLVVDERFRGRGIGSLLIRRAEQWAKKKKLGWVYLRSNIIRERAHAFYSRLGYRKIKTQHAFLKNM